MAEKEHPVQSIDRVLDILEVLSAAPQGMNLSDLAQATSLHISTAHRLLTSLSSRGYARKDPGSGKYRLTLRLYEISRRVSSVLALLPASEELLKELSNFSQEAVHLVERSGNEVLYLYKFEPYLHPISISSSVGSRNPMYCTGVGKSILALLPAGEVSSIWESTDVQPYTPHTRITLEELERDLSEVRRSGYALDDEEHDIGIRCIAAAIRDWQGSPIGAISISAPASHLTPQAIDRLSPRLIAAAAEISRMLGFVDPESAER